MKYDIKVWRFLNIDSLAIDACFGLEHCILNNVEKAKPLLMKGIQFCDVIQKGNFAMTNKVINQSCLDAWEDIQILVRYKSPEELRDIIEKAIWIKIDLMKIIQDDTVYSEDDIRKIQKFFIDVSEPYLSEAYNIFRRRKCPYM